jgi:DNA/RNA endonuclease G (NUC1)
LHASRRRFFGATLIVFAALTSTLAVAQDPGSAPGYDHDKWVTTPVDIVRRFEAFTVSFDGNDDDDGDGDQDNWRIPQWVAYEIKHHNTPVPSFDRPEWFTDQVLFQQKIAPNDDSYLGEATRWNRGHMCMKNHASRISAAADHNTHTLLNAVPQSARLNQGIWLDLEEMTGDWADDFGRVWIICGPILRNGRPRGWLGQGDELRVAIPGHCFKIVVRESSDPGRPNVLAFIYPNSESRRVLPDQGGPFNHRKFLRSVDDIEKATGLDFLTALDDAVEDDLERVKAQALWPAE